MDVASLQSWLIARLSSQLGTEAAEIDTGESFSRYGLDSTGAIALATELSGVLGRKVSPTVFWRYPNFRDLAHSLCQNGTQNSVPKATPTVSAAPPSLEPIAVIGLGCRLPGDARDPKAFWRFLCEGGDAIREIPPDRWDAAEFWDPDVGAAGKMDSRKGAFLDQIDTFDPSFFSISPREAAEMDPQQRLALEVAWEAMQDAGISPRSLRGRQGGVYLGAMWRDFVNLRVEHLDHLGAYSTAGECLSLIANRLSYFLGLRGPSMVIDSACSSSLVAVHLACQSLRSGEIEIALAGGVNLLLSPATMVGISKFGGLSPDGRCKAFDHRANGFGRGEGVGVVVLKRLSRALADGDPVYCVVRGSAVNNDGASNGLTAPNPEAQEEVLRAAYANASRNPNQVHYVEAHGTGTALGDPIEASALGAVLGAGRNAKRPVLVGSVKTNLGHLEGAAGIAGFIKAVLAIHHRTLPASLHFEQANPHISFEELGLEVCHESQPLPAGDGPALVGVSSFGLGGTNCHVVLEETPRPWVQLLPLAAESPEELKSLARNCQEMVADEERTPKLMDFCQSMAQNLCFGEYRLAITFRNRGELLDFLARFLSNSSRPGLATGQVDGERKLAFVFSPYISQCWDIGEQLHAHEPVFRATVERCDRLFSQYLTWSIREALTHSGGHVQFADVTVMHPILFTVQVALAALLRSWGIQPDVVIGHSVGEIAAAHVAGLFDLEDAVQLLYAYSRFSHESSRPAAMIQVELPASEVEQAVRPYGDGIAIAGFNSPTSTVVAGERIAVERCAADFESKGALIAKLDIDVAAHSPTMDSVLGGLSAELRKLTPQQSKVPMVSTVSGDFGTSQSFDGEYWVRNLRQPVRFQEAQECLLAAGFDVFLEIGPEPILTRPMQQTLRHRQHSGIALATLRRFEDQRTTLLDALGVLYTLGHPVAWTELLPPSRSLELPPEMMAFQGAKKGDDVSAVDSQTELLVLSAHRPRALWEEARNLRSFVAEEPGVRLRDICFTTARSRSQHQHRLALQANSSEELEAGLEAFCNGQEWPGLASGRAPSKPPTVVFVFPGQSSGWLGLARALQNQESIFSSTLEHCGRALASASGWSLEDWMAAEEADPRLDRPDVLEPAQFAAQIALARLWCSWGIEPAAVIGQGVGEVVAAHVGGILSLDEAAEVVCRARQVAPRRDSEATDFFATAYQDAEIPLYSTLSGYLETDRDTHLQQPLAFHEAMERLLVDGFRIFLEINSHRSLLLEVEELLETWGKMAPSEKSGVGASPAVALPSSRISGGRGTLLASAGALYTLGCPLNWETMQPAGDRGVRLPPFSWQRKHCWPEWMAAKKIHAEVVS